MQTGAKSDPIDAKYLVTGVSFGRIVAIYVATGAISGAIGMTRDTESKKRGKGAKGKRVKGEEGKGTTFSPVPLFPSYPSLFVIPSSLMNGVTEVIVIPSITSRRQARPGLSST